MRYFILELITTIMGELELNRLGEFDVPDFTTIIQKKLF